MDYERDTQYCEIELHEAIQSACRTDITPRPVVTGFVVIAEVLDDDNNRWLTKIPLTDGGTHELPSWTMHGWLDHILRGLEDST